MIFWFNDAQLMAENPTVLSDGAASALAYPTVYLADMQHAEQPGAA